MNRVSASLRLVWELPPPQPHNVRLATASSNFHRPCLFPTEVTSASGRVRKTYRQDDVATPYQRFRSMPGAEGFLRPGVTLEALDQLAAATTDLDAAKAVQRARDELFRAIGKARDSAA